MNHGRFYVRMRKTQLIALKTIALSNGLSIKLLKMGRLKSGNVQNVVPHMYGRNPLNVNVVVVKRLPLNTSHSSHRRFL